MHDGKVYKITEIVMVGEKGQKRRHAVLDYPGDKPTSVLAEEIGPASAREVTLYHGDEVRRKKVAVKEAADKLQREADAQVAAAASTAAGEQEAAAAAQLVVCREVANELLDTLLDTAVSL